MCLTTTRRWCSNALCEVNKSPVDIDRQAWRKPFYKQVPFLEPPPESRFEPFNCFPDVASKYSSVLKNAVPSFENYSVRNPIKKSELDKQNMAQVMLDPNKELVMKPLNLGYHDFEGMALASEERERLHRDLSGHKAMILRHHGLLTVGADCAEAFSLMYALELSCRVQMDVLASGQPYRLPPEDLCEHTARQLNGFPVPPSEREWPGLLTMLQRVNPGFEQ